MCDTVDVSVINIDFFLYYIREICSVPCYLYIIRDLENFFLLFPEDLVYYCGNYLAFIPF